ncbi:MAG: molybdate ABC transporter substrate-binding protein [Rhodospirillaceae bacterium]
MATLRILSAGAAQAVVEQVQAAFERDTGHTVEKDCGAVGAMKKRVVDGEPVDVILLTRALIDELVASGHAAPDSVHDLGKVGTGVAVRVGTPLPEVSNDEALRGNLLAATRIVFPDPDVATAGKVIMRMLESLGIAEQVRDRIQYFPNGYAAMKWLGQSTGTHEIGMTQVSEILANKGVTYVGPFPEKYQMKAVYSVALASNSASPDLARDFIGRLAAPSFRPQLQAAGYEL